MTKFRESGESKRNHDISPSWRVVSKLGTSCLAKKIQVNLEGLVKDVNKLIADLPGGGRFPDTVPNISINVNEQTDQCSLASPQTSAQNSPELPPAWFGKQPVENIQYDNQVEDGDGESSNQNTNINESSILRAGGDILLQCNNESFSNVFGILTSPSPKAFKEPLKQSSIKFSIHGIARRNTNPTQIIIEEESDVEEIDQPIQDNVEEDYTNLSSNFTNVIGILKTPSAPLKRSAVGSVSKLKRSTGKLFIHDSFQKDETRQNASSAEPESHSGSPKLTSGSTDNHEMDIDISTSESDQSISREYSTLIEEYSTFLEESSISELPPFSPILLDVVPITQETNTTNITNAISSGFFYELTPAPKSSKVTPVIPREAICLAECLEENRSSSIQTTPPNSAQHYNLLQQSSYVDCNGSICSIRRDGERLITRKTMSIGLHFREMMTKLPIDETGDEEFKDNIERQDSFLLSFDNSQPPSKFTELPEMIVTQTSDSTSSILGTGNSIQKGESLSLMEPSFYQHEQKKSLEESKKNSPTSMKPISVTANTESTTLTDQQTPSVIVEKATPWIGKNFFNGAIELSKVNEKYIGDESIRIRPATYLGAIRESSAMFRNPNPNQIKPKRKPYIFMREKTCGIVFSVKYLVKTIQKAYKCSR